jgi:DHA1 family multidrug resistance protein-like MFS transporter
LTLLYPIARWSEQRFRLEHRLMAGLLVMTVAMPIGLTSNLQQLFTLICLYIGSIIAEPARETLGASLATPGRAAAIWASADWGWPLAARWLRRRRLAVRCG